jgi:hypothetical protein
MKPSTGIALLVALIVAEGAVFGAMYWDLIYLSLPASRLTADAGTFRKSAARALDRPDLRRRHLETIATVASLRNEQTLALAALQRLVSRHPGEAKVSLRLAEALRSLHRYEEAEAIYRRLLAGSAGGR